MISPERIKSLLTETVKHEHVTGITRCRSQGGRSTVREKAAGRTARDGRSRTSPPETNVRACISINQRYQKKTPATSWNECTCQNLSDKTYHRKLYLIETADVTETAIYLSLWRYSHRLSLHKHSWIIMSHRSSNLRKKRTFHVNAKHKCKISVNFNFFNSRAAFLHVTS